MTFYAAKTPHHCKLSVGQKVEDFVPVVTRNNEEEWDGCRVYTGYNSTETEPCSHGWVYELNGGERTIISEFDLVCEDAYKSELATTIYFSGVMVGSLLYGFLADKYGRKPILAIAQLAGGLLSFAIFAFRNYYAFVVLRFFLGIQTQGILNISFVLAMELFPTKHRAKFGVFFGITSVLGGWTLGILAYLIRDWKYIQLAISFIPFIHVLLLCFVPESIRWLFLQKRYEKAEHIVHRIVAFNHLPYPGDIIEEIKESGIEDMDQPTQDRRGNVLDLFRSPSLRRTSLILIIIWFTVSAAFYGLAFNISYLFGDKYLNFGISEAVDMCAVLLMLWALPRFGRRKPLAIAYFICGTANVISVITNATQSDATGVRILGTATALLGKSSAVSLFMSLSTFTAELYPTIIRNISLGVNSAWSRIGGMLSPQIFLLGMHTATFVPYAILGVFSLTSGLLILLLPETHNKSLMDTLTDQTIIEVQRRDVEADIEDQTSL